MIEKLRNFIVVVVGNASATIVISAIIGLPIMWLWDWLMPAIFGLKTITFWQAIGIAALSWLIFRGGKTSN